MSTEISNQLIIELSEVLSEYSTIESGTKARLVDQIFAYRLLLGRMPDREAELTRLAATQTTWREFLGQILDSDEFSKRLDFLPSGLRLMSDVNGFRFWFDSSDREMGAQMAAGTYEIETASTIGKIVQPGMICLDIGAQTGFYTCIMAQLVGSKGKVVAFEPVDRSFGLLQRNIEENGWLERVSSYNCACSDTSGTMRVGVASGMMVADPCGSHKVNTVRIDDIELQNVDFCKIDVEGHEPKVIKGMEKILAQTSPIILTEVNQYWLKQAGSSASEYMNLLRDFGYKMYNVEAGYSEIQSLAIESDLANVNLLALPNDQCARELVALRS